jgi:methyl-accepting chemotaxis protein
MTFSRLALLPLAVAAAAAAPTAAVVGLLDPAQALLPTAVVAIGAAVAAATEPARKAKAVARAVAAEPAKAPPPPVVAPPPSADAGARAEADTLATALGHLRSGALASRTAGGDAEAAKLGDAALAAAQSAVDEALAICALLAGGDLSVRASSGHPGLYGDLTKGLNGVAVGLREIIGALQGALGDMADRGGALRRAAETLSGQVHDQITALDSARGAGAALTDAVARVARAADEGEAIAARVAADARAGAERSAQATAAIARVKGASKRIVEVLDAITGIARQTKLLGVNAAVEAARAGGAGRGFAVVASEVQALAERAAEAARRIEGFVDASDAAVADCAAEVDACAVTLTRVADEIGAVTRSADAIRTACGAQTITLDAALDAIGAADAAARLGESVASQTAEAAGGLDLAAAGLRARLEGVMLEDHSMEDAVIARAAEVSRLFEDGVRSGRIGMEALFSPDYQRIEGTDPPQFRTAYTDFTDAVLPRVLEGALALGPHVVFCAAVNKDGFLPTHNRKFSMAQGGDPVWNTANCRNRRFFADRVGLAAGRSTAPVLIQAYRRDMGGGAFATMKDISAPIMVQGRHWGGLRIGYRAPTARLGAPASRAA